MRDGVRLSTIVDISPLQHLGQDPAYLLNGQLLAPDVLPLIVLLGRRLDADVRELGWEQDAGFQPGQGGIARRR